MPLKKLTKTKLAMTHSHKQRIKLLATESKFGQDQQRHWLVYIFELWFTFGPILQCLLNSKITAWGWDACSLSSKRCCCQAVSNSGSRQATCMQMNTKGHHWINWTWPYSLWTMLYTGCEYACMFLLYAALVDGGNDFCFAQPISVLQGSRVSWEPDLEKLLISRPRLGTCSMKLQTRASAV